MGLMQQAGAAPQEEPTQAAPEGQGPEEADESNVSPEEQKAYDEFVGQAATIIYGKGEVRPEILEALKPAQAPAEDPAGGNPAVLALANAATQIVQKLDTSAKEQGVDISDDVLYHGGSEVVEMLAEVAEAAGFHDYTEEEINGAFLQAVDNYRPIAEEMGRTDADTLKSQFGEIQQADAEGKLDSLLPGLKSKEGEAPAVDE